MLLGVEIGGTKLQIVAGERSRILHRWRGTVRKDLGGRGICEQLGAAIPQVLEAAGVQRVEAGAVGFGGPIDIRSGKVCTSHQIDGWEGFPLRDWLSDLIGAPVAVDNDANTAALGEAVAGVGKGADPLFYVTLGSGVGGGFVSGGNIYHGCPPGEAEFGHLRLDRDGATVESRCSGWSIDARIRKVCTENSGGLLARLTAGKAGSEARHLAAAIDQNDPAAVQLLSELAADLAFALSHVTHLLHPQLIVLGGGLSLVGEPLRKAVADALPAFVMRAMHPTPAVKLAGLGEDAVPAGALELAARCAPASQPQLASSRPKEDFSVSEIGLSNKRGTAFMSAQINESPVPAITDWIEGYRAQQHAAINSIPAESVARLIDRLRAALKDDTQIFIFGNGGSAANASHFATDLGKGSSDKCKRRFRVLSLNDNVSWITALGNDYHYDEIFSRQLHNYAKPGDVVITLSVSGNSPNLVKAVEWANENGLFTAALVGAKRGKLADLADEVIVINSHHYGRVEDAQMTICHMLCYAFMEMPELQNHESAESKTT